MTVKVIYILGLGHSGTTLLSRILGTHSQIVATGGSKNVPLFVNGEKDCSCGATHPRNCSFWSAVDQELGKRGTTLDKLQFRYGDSRPDPDSVRNFYSAVMDAGNAKAVIDTSRRVSYYKALQQVEGIEFIPVHIFKDPRAQCASSKRKGASAWSGIWNYNVRSRRIRALDATRQDMIHLSYEALCLDPKTQIERILEKVGVDFEPRQLTEFAAGESHVLGGNKQLRKKNVRITLDQSWRDRLNAFEKKAIRLLNQKTWQHNMQASGGSHGALSEDR